MKVELDSKYNVGDKLRMYPDIYNYNNCEIIDLKFTNEFLYLVEYTNRTRKWVSEDKLFFGAYGEQQMKITLNLSSPYVFAKFLCCLEYEEIKGLLQNGHGNYKDIEKDTEEIDKVFYDAYEQIEKKLQEERNNEQV